MSKGFAEVFPTLKLTEPIRELMNQTVVDQVTATKKQDLIRIYLHSPNLIAKSDLYRVEDAIRKQLFPGVSLSVSACTTPWSVMAIAAIGPMPSMDWREGMILPSIT